MKNRDVNANKNTIVKRITSLALASFIFCNLLNFYKRNGYDVSNLDGYSTVKIIDFLDEDDDLFDNIIRLSSDFSLDGKELNSYFFDCYYESKGFYIKFPTNFLISLNEEDDLNIDKYFSNFREYIENLDIDDISTDFFLEFHELNLIEKYGMTSNLRDVWEENIKIIHEVSSRYNFNIKIVVGQKLLSEELDLFDEDDIIVKSPYNIKKIKNKYWGYAYNVDSSINKVFVKKN